MSRSSSIQFLLDRPRHADLIAEIRAAGAHVILRNDGIVGALLACMPQSGVDILMGIGGIPEALLAACAVKSWGGALLGRLAPQTPEEKKAILDAGFDPGAMYRADEFVKSKQVFFATTGITNSPLSRGVINHGNNAETNSRVLRCETGTRRTIQAEHDLEKWLQFNK